MNRPRVNKKTYALLKQLSAEYNDTQENILERCIESVHRASKFDDIPYSNIGRFERQTLVSLRDTANILGVSEHMLKSALPSDFFDVYKHEAGRFLIPPEKIYEAYKKLVEDGIISYADSIRVFRRIQKLHSIKELWESMLSGEAC